MTFVLSILIPSLVCAAGASPSIKHVRVYDEPGRFAGWPANHGIWTWDNEILVGFTSGHHRVYPNRHNIDRDRPRYALMARSLDGGLTWTTEKPRVKRAPGAPATDTPGLQGGDPIACPGGIDFTHPGFAMTIRGPNRMFYSTDRGRRWIGPYALPDFGTPGLLPRTDYIVEAKHACTVFLTVNNLDGKEGRPICVRTRDGGKSWKLAGWIGEEPEGFHIMPASVRLDASTLLVAIRCRSHKRGLRWIDLWASHDNGQTWKVRSTPAPNNGSGNPPALIKLRDGRLCLAYGYRVDPPEMRARISDDDGKTWGRVITLRKGIGNRDIGYPRMVQRPDGKLVTVYYFNDDPNVNSFIEAVIWDPSQF